MIVVKILGILDIIAGIFFWLFCFFHIIPKPIIILLAFYLLVKGLSFLLSFDIASIFDVVFSIIIFLSLSLTIPKVIVVLFVILLIQKGILSLVS